jgi:hypothetical protein
LTSAQNTIAGLPRDQKRGQKGKSKKKPLQRKGEKNGIRHWGFGCDSFSVCNCLFGSANIKNYMTTAGK